jgi:hypothetical protein
MITVHDANHFISKYDKNPKPVHMKKPLDSPILNFYPQRLIREKKCKESIIAVIAICWPFVKKGTLQS